MRIQTESAIGHITKKCRIANSAQEKTAQIQAN